MNKKIEPKAIQKAILAIDFQEGLLEGIEHAQEVLQAAQKLLFAAQELNIPIIGTEQAPDLMGPTMPEWREDFPYDIYSRSSFSALKNAEISKAIEESNAQEWILVGFETHISLYQTARDLIQKGKKVILVNDATASSSIYDYSTALAALRDLGAQILSSEMLIFDWLQDIENPCTDSVLGMLSVGQSDSSSCCSGGSCCK